MCSFLALVGEMAQFPCLCQHPQPRYCVDIEWSLIINRLATLNTNLPYVRELAFNQATHRGKVYLENLPLELNGSIVQCRDVYNRTEDEYGEWMPVDTLIVEG